MVTEKTYFSRKGGIRIRQISLEDCTSEYVRWLNDPEVNKYLETRWIAQDIDSVREFVKAQRENNHSILFAIEETDTESHIGNIKIGPINLNHRHADISYFIGNKNMWRKGFATEAIGLILKCGFEDLRLHRIEAGCYAAAIGSWKALENNGFKREGDLREWAVSEKGYMNVYRYGILEYEYRNRSKEK